MKDKYRGIPSRISHLRHGMNDYLIKEMRQRGWNEISPSHGGIIYALFANEVLSMKEIAQKVKRDPSTVTTLINKLVKLGYAKYTINPNDLRSKQVSLTDDGKELYDDFNAISTGLINTLLDDVSDDEAENFILTIEKLNKNIKKGIKS